MSSHHEVDIRMEVPDEEAIHLKRTQTVPTYPKGKHAQTSSIEFRDDRTE